VGAPLSPALFATDARGSESGDGGGFGVVCTAASQQEMESAFDASHTLGFTVARLSGDTSGLRRPEAALARTVPFTVLPDALLKQERWKLLEAGTWAQSDHITLGEGRAVVRLVRRLAAAPGWHRRTILSLEDNRAVAGALGKGRSPSGPVNHICRQVCAAVLAAGNRLLLPWVETSRQMADGASRL